MEFSPCGMMRDEPVELCPPLKQLKQEHGPLNEKKYALFVEAEKISKGEEKEVQQALQRLRENVQQFFQELELHSHREEEVLFPMVARYIGKDVGPIAVMEYEHDQAKEYIMTFLKKTETINAHDAKDLASYVINAYNILTDHFSKEEQVLFPMAEKLLSNKEKEELAKKLLKCEAD
ncbi:hemerythrin domain-containing protein [Bacillus sp. FJAT-47783]|uniref:hemerythrin domain-containing protein n=1 Tax=Bacillus sp. FJAT-47783 TaxID=2922712 RepID=UPI001FACE012|nr:hemerythrin domain-containing protein [Bacillus sp. FJAT-47783]